MATKTSSSWPDTASRLWDPPLVQDVFGSCVSNWSTDPISDPVSYPQGVCLSFHPLHSDLIRSYRRSLLLYFHRQI
ncbi:unnamed protein product [Brassica oleracea var. botrytis]